MIRCRICRPLLAARRILRRMSASSGLAESAMVSSSKMAPWILSSKNLLVCRAENRWSSTVFSPCRSRSYSETRREAVSRSATSSSSLVFSTPPWSARFSARDTSFTPEKLGLP